MKSIIFCDVCGKPMHHSASGNGILWKCECGFSKETALREIISEKISRQEVGEGIVKPEKRDGGFPHVCKKCGYDTADIDTISAFYSDESDISLYRCQKCGHVERETDGTSNAF